MTRTLFLPSLVTILILLSLTMMASAYSQNLNPQHSKLDTYLNTLNDNGKVMTAVYVSQYGKTLYEFYAGKASIEANVAISANTRFRIGSITKIFTSVLVMQLIEEGKLSLDTTLDTYYPDIPNAKRITIKHLLSHRSGIASFTDAPDFLGYMTKPQSRKQMEQRVGSTASLFKPGSKHQYSNSNYLLLGFIIETLYQKPYAEVISEKIATPLGLVNTYFGDSIEIEENEASSYRYADKWKRQPDSHMSVPHAAGAIVSSAKETNQFLSALFAGKLVSDTSLTAMKELEDGYGLGMFAAPFYGQAFMGHNGRIDGFVSATGHNEADGVTVTVLSNGVNYNFNDVLVAVLSSIYKRDFDIPDFSAKPVELSTQVKNKVVGSFSSDQLPLDISFRIEGKQLMTQATGQGAFPVTPYSDTEFRFDPAGIVIHFDPASLVDGKLNAFTLNQGGGKFQYKRKE